MTAVSLTIAGSDPSGGAGLQADLKTFHQHGVYGMAVVTLLTVQNTRGVDRVEAMDAELVRQQLDAVVTDIPPGAAKTGALGSADVVEAVSARAGTFSFPLVVDPVMISKHGTPLLAEDAQQAVARRLVPQAYVVTPNAHEASVLAGREVRDLESAREAARAIATLGPRAVVVKGGHVGDDAVDVLWLDDQVHELPGPRVETEHTHGTGCIYASAITAHLARGVELPEAARRAKAWVTEALRHAPRLGGGIGPADLFTCVP